MCVCVCVYDGLLRDACRRMCVCVCVYDGLLRDACKEDVCVCVRRLTEGRLQEDVCVCVRRLTKGRLQEDVCVCVCVYDGLLRDACRRMCVCTTAY